MVLLQFSPLTSYTNTTIDSTQFLQHDFHEIGYELYRTNPYSAFVFFSDAVSFFESRHDTSNLITSKIGIADIGRRQGRYNYSFEILADIKNNYIRNTDYSSKSRLYTRIGRLYGIYGQDSIALCYHKDALRITKTYCHSKNITNKYFSVAEQLTKLEKYDTAISYLDSCYLSHEGKNRQIYVDAVYALCSIKKGDYRKADIYLKGLIPLFKDKELGFLAKLYSFNGELKMCVNQADSAVYYYEKALCAANKMKQHYEIKPKVLEQLAYLYKNKNNTEKAYKYLLMHKKVSDSLFNLQSEQNKELFEIKNDYREDIYRKEELIITQERVIELSNKASLRLKIILTGLLLFALVALFTLWQRRKMTTLVDEKRKNEELIEVKNKELTANALQFIEKEHAFTELLEHVKTQAPDKFSSFYTKSKQSNKRIWEDFHLRFTQTNSLFYKSLRELHPDLTPTDLKHCALVKLNFDSKEMALILGISVHGVHTARSRIRKKIGLKREDNLSNYFGNL